MKFKDFQRIYVFMHPNTFDSELGRNGQFDELPYWAYEEFCKFFGFAEDYT